MGAGIVLVGELVQYLAFSLALQLLSQVARAFHALLLRHQHDLRAKGAHRRAPFRTHVLGHDQDHAVTADGGDHGQRDTGVAAGGLDECVTRLDLPAPFGAPDHAQRGPILYRTGGIVSFQLGQQNIGGPPRQSLQAHQRRVAHAGLQRWKFSFRGHVCFRTIVAP